MTSYLRFLAGRERTEKGDRHLGLTLAFVAGAINAGGFLAVGHYTSHMTGIVSSVADDLVLGRLAAAELGVAALLSFLCGAGVTAALVNWARRAGLSSLYALPLLLESLLLLVFGLVGANLRALTPAYAAATVLLLCGMMGLQNAIITKISGARIRTTHLTGLATDLGIELGKLFYWNFDRAREAVTADRKRMTLLSSLLASFFVGGLVGALGFKRAGFVSTLPLAALLFSISALPIYDDIAAGSAG